MPILLLVSFFSLEIDIYCKKSRERLYTVTMAGLLLQDNCDNNALGDYAMSLKITLFLGYTQRRAEVVIVL